MPQGVSFVKRAQRCQSVCCGLYEAGRCLQATTDMTKQEESQCRWHGVTTEGREEANATLMDQFDVTTPRAQNESQSVGSHMIITSESLSDD